jgi:hypothetical protein
MEETTLAPEAQDGEDRAAELSIEELLGKRGAKKLVEIYGLIDQHEQAVASLALKTARAYFDAGAILAKAALNFNYKRGRLSYRTFAKTCGVPERRIALSFKIFAAFEHNPDALNGLSLRETVKLISPAPESGEGYNRVELGGNPGQPELDFGELFKLPAATNPALKNHRTIADYLTEIIVVSRTEDGQLVNKRFARFMEDLPQEPALRTAYKTMALQTQAAIEAYLAALEEHEQGGSL